MAYLDSRNLQARLEWLEHLEEEEIKEEDRKELDELHRVKEEVGEGWAYGITFVPEDEFEDYARELAVDIGAPQDPNQWPIYCIDWAWAANELKRNYTPIIIHGKDYWYYA